MPELTKSNLQDIVAYLKELFLQGTTVSTIGTNTLVSVGSSSQHLQEVTHLTNQIRSSHRNSLSLIFTGISGSGKSNSFKSILQTLQTQHSYLCTLLDTFTHAITPHCYNATRAIKLSRFHFNTSGEIIGFEIAQHLLLDSFRVTSRNGFNFHCFYLLANGAPTQTINELFLGGIGGKYVRSQKDLGAGIDAKKGYEVMMKVFKECGFDCDTIASILELLSAILLIGGLEFAQTGLTTCRVSNEDQLGNISTLIGAQKEKLADSLTHVTLQTKTGARIKTTLSIVQARIVCDSLSRSLYSKLIGWLIQKINSKSKSQPKAVKILNVLEIPGFEDGTESSLEGLLINYTFEKVNNMVTSFVIRERQLEFEKEEIQTLNLKPFDNFNICHLLVDNFRGILPVIDTSCMQKNVDSKTVMKNLNLNCANSVLYASGISISVRASNSCFVIKHHLGHVCYDVTNFKQKNLDRPSFNLTELLAECQHPCLVATVEKRDKVRSLIKQTREVLGEISNTIKGSEIFNVLCIRPNPKLELGLFDRNYVTEQVKYMNLTEIVKIQQSGFPFSENISSFLEKYQSLAGFYSNKSPRETCKRLLLGFNIQNSEFVLGKTKVFFSTPDPLTILQQVREISFTHAAVVIQKYFKGWVARVQFRTLRRSQIVVSSNFRASQQRKHFLTLRMAADTIGRYTRGYQTRNWYYWVLEERDRISAVTLIASYFRAWRVRRQFKFQFSGNATELIQRFFLNCFRYLYLTRLARSLPSLSPVRFDWPDSPGFVRETSDILFTLYHSWRCELYRGTLLRNPSNFLKMKEKLLANNIFRRKKAVYQKSVPVPFQGDRLGLATNSKWKRVALQTGGFTPIVWDSSVLKVNRTNGKFQERILVVTRQDVLLIDPTNFKLLQQFTLHTLKQISVSKYSDGCFILHLSTLTTVSKSSPMKGDLIFMCPHVIELIVKTYLAVKEVTNRSLPVFIGNEIEVFGKEGEKIFVDFVYAKGGQFMAQPKRHGNRLIFTL